MRKWALKLPVVVRTEPRWHHTEALPGTAIDAGTLHVPTTFRHPYAGMLATASASDAYCTSKGQFFSVVDIGVFTPPGGATPTMSPPLPPASWP